MNIYNYVTLGSAAIVIILILVQTRGASLGAGLGGTAEINTVRRGSDQTLHQITILMVGLFAGSIILSVVA